MPVDPGAHTSEGQQVRRQQAGRNCTAPGGGATRSGGSSGGVPQAAAAAVSHRHQRGGGWRAHSHVAHEDAHHIGPDVLAHEQVQDQEGKGQVAALQLHDAK